MMRLLTDEPDLLGALMRMSSQRIVNEATLAAIRTSSQEEAGKWLAQRQELTSPIMAAREVDVGNRFSDLNNVMLILRGKAVAVLELLTFLDLEPVFAAKTGQRSMLPGNLDEVDWNIVLREINAVDDEAVAILNEQDVVKRCMAAKKFSERLEAAGTPGNLFVYEYTHDGGGTMSQRMDEERENLVKSLKWFLERGEKETREAYSKRIAKLFTHAEGTLNQCLRLASRQDSENQVYTAAMGVEAYRIDHGVYPDAPGAVVPAYLKSLPKDLFTGGDLVYRKRDAGYLIYSVGLNGKDDGGEVEGHRAEDDVGVWWDGK